MEKIASEWDREGDEDGKQAAHAYVPQWRQLFKILHSVISIKRGSGSEWEWKSQRAAVVFGITLIPSSELNVNLSASLRLIRRQKMPPPSPFRPNVDFLLPPYRMWSSQSRQRIDEINGIIWRFVSTRAFLKIISARNSKNCRHDDKCLKTRFD